MRHYGSMHPFLRCVSFASVRRRPVAPDAQNCTVNAVEKAYREHRAVLVNYIARRIGSARSAEDVAQDIFLRLLQSKRIDDVRESAAYLNVIAAHLVYDVHIRQRREVVVFDSHLAELAADQAMDWTNDVLADRLEIDQQLDLLLSCVPTLQAAIVVMKKGGRSEL